MLLAPVANRIVLIVSPELISAGLMLAIMNVLALPPSDSCGNQAMEREAQCAAGERGDTGQTQPHTRRREEKLRGEER